MSRHNRDRRTIKNAAKPEPKPKKLPDFFAPALRAAQGGAVRNLPMPPSLIKHGECGNLSLLGNAGIGHREEPSRELPPARILGQNPDLPDMADWVCGDAYYGTVRKLSGFFIGGGDYYMIGISATDNTAAHDWRDFQHLKNTLLGPEWEGVELYPAESRLRDPSNRFYLWCVPAGILRFGFGERVVLDANESTAPQRPYPKPKSASNGEAENRSSESTTQPNGETPAATQTNPRTDPHDGPDDPRSGCEAV